MVSEVSYLGHKISKEGIKVILKKIDVILNIPIRDDVSQLFFSTSVAGERLKIIIDNKFLIRLPNTVKMVPATLSTRILR